MLGDLAFAFRRFGNMDGFELFPRFRGPRLAVLRLPDAELIAANFDLGNRRVVSPSK
jgi:hypothetical protein